MTIMRYITSFLIGLFFIFLGLLKVAPVELDHGFGHEQFESIFNDHFASLPFKSMFAVTITPDILMSAIGFIEVVCGTMLAFGRSSWQRVGTFYLLIIVVGAYIAQQQVGGSSLYLNASTFVIGVALAFLLIHKESSVDH
ncbi:transmembrane protein 35A-like [Lytechinus variegatus]|uniref:transmembrane protein 35A-like n=1 Tax=Lytechinus variegatus TaxID=7654 RepID=UPI001BB21E28|nr:transmembrane protein 35A-like [Lytechinus variegatus]